MEEERRPFSMEKGSFLYPEQMEWEKEYPFSVKRGEHFYGCGETFLKFDLRGEKVRIWVAEHQNEKLISGKLEREAQVGKDPRAHFPFEAYESYYVQPTFVSSEKYFVHVDGSSYMEFDFSKEEEVTLRLMEDAPVIVEHAESFEELSQKLSDLLGRTPPLPDWLYDGIILASQTGCEAVEKKLEEAKAADIPVSAVWCQDWSGCRKTGFGYQVMWNWTYDEDLYTDLPERIHAWKQRGIRFLGYINPFLAIEKDLYSYASARGYCVKNQNGEDYLVTITTFPAAMVDLTNPDAWDWYKRIIQKTMIGIGMSGWMADFGEYLPVDCVLYSGEDPMKVHNRWPALWAKLNREAVEEVGMGEEIFFFTRAGFTETIKYGGCMWTGDQHVDWSYDNGMPSVIPATLSLAMSGYGITHSDVGGYTTKEQMTRSRELLLRWEEMNVFSPVMRFHEGNQPSRNIQFDRDEELLAHLSVMGKLHVALGDYLRACVQEAAERGIPVMRPLFYHYEEPWAYEESYEYLLGRDILVAPVLEEGARRRACRLPQDQWVHLFTGEEYSGGEVVVDAPIGRPPVFIRASSVWLKSLKEKSDEIFFGQCKTR